MSGLPLSGDGWAVSFFGFHWGRGRLFDVRSQTATKQDLGEAAPAMGACRGDRCHLCDRPCSFVPLAKEDVGQVGVGFCGFVVQGLLRPDDFAVSGVPGAPASSELGDQEQSPAALVGGLRPAQVRRGVGVVGDLADQIAAVVQQAQPDGLGAVPDGVGDQLADDQFGGEGQMVQAPGLQLTGDSRRGRGRRPLGRRGCPSQRLGRSSAAACGR